MRLVDLIQRSIEDRRRNEKSREFKKGYNENKPNKNGSNEEAIGS